jgi:hypothetical protein
MMLIRRNDRRGLSHRKWLLGVGAVLCSLALIAPASSSAKKAVRASATVDPSCSFVEVSGTWQGLRDQAYVGVELTDKRTGNSVSSGPLAVAPTATSATVNIGGVLSALPRRSHGLAATFTVYDSSLRELGSDTDNGRMECELTPVVLPT